VKVEDKFRQDVAMKSKESKIKKDGEKLFADFIVDRNQDESRLLKDYK